MQRFAEEFPAAKSFLTSNSLVMLLHELSRKRKKMKTWILFLTLLPAHQLAAQGEQQIVYSYAAKDSAVTAISTRYEPKSFLHKMIMGKNYRSTWSTPVNLPVFHLSGSGFTIEKLGGGQQTKSLRLKDKQGKEWALRTVDKEVSGAIPKSLNNTIVEKVVQDMISASYPYGSVIVGKLSGAAGIIAPRPVMYVVADDPALGQYRSLFANTVCTLEERKPGNSDTEDTEEVLEKLKKENENLVLQKKLLRARLMDMLVGDWDRHERQVSWATIDSGNKKLYYIIPRDRDNALFYSGGLLPRFARLTFMKHISGFKKNSNNIKRLSKKAWHFDKMFLNELDAAAWQEVIKDFQNKISDSVIIASVKTLPAPVYEMDGGKLMAKLKSRRDGLLKNAMKYYDFLSGTVTISGSNEEEIFVAKGNGKKLNVTVFKQDEKGRHKIYERSFDRSETGFVRLDGLDGNDQFIIDGTAESKIKLKIYGSGGKDVYDIKGKTRSTIFDSQSESNVVVNNSSARINFK